MNSGQEKSIRPFIFERSFDLIGASDDIEAGHKKNEEGEEAAPTFSEDEVKEAREVAYKDGLQAGLQEATISIEQKVLSTLEIIGSTLNRLDEQQQAANELIARETIDLAVTAVEKLLPQFIETVGTKDIEVFVHNILSRILEEPKIIVTVAEELIPEVERNLIDQAGKIGYSGDITVAGDASLGPADCRIRWTEGEAERLLESTRREINSLASSTPSYKARKLEIAADTPSPELAAPITNELDEALPTKSEISVEAETSTEQPPREATVEPLEIPQTATDPEEAMPGVLETDIAENNTDETSVDEGI